MHPREQIALNFMRPDVGRPGNHDFVHLGPWLVSQFRELGVGWNRLAFSWVLAQPEPDRYDWSAYDRIVSACDAAGISVLATLGGHFDRPPVPAWAGSTLAEVVNQHPEYLERFVHAWAERYRGSIKHWEILNEPRTFHVGLTVSDYVERILKPSYRIINEVDPGASVLPCAYNHLPVIGEQESFWEAARGHYDVHNLHIYTDWGYYRTDTGAWREEAAARRFREQMVAHGEGDKQFWITETGWWGTGSLTGSAYDFWRRDPRTRLDLQPHYTGREILDHPIVQREDEHRALWMAEVFPRLLAVPGCEKVFLWVSMDEFEGGFDPERLYGRQIEGEGQPRDSGVGQVDLWGIIAGDRTWRGSARILQQLLRG